jgi:DNA-binding CsgD family transcriptional regulator
MPYTARVNYLTFIAAVVFTVSLIEGVYVLIVNLKAPANRLYFFMTLCLGVWLFGAAMAYTAHTRDEVVLFFRISSFGFVFLHAFTLHFSIRVSGYSGALSARFLPALLYLPSFYFMYKSLTDLIVYRDFIRPGKLWLAIPAFGNLDLLLLVIHYVSYYIASAVLLMLWRKRTSSRRERKQAGLMLVSTVSTIFLFNLEPFILPLFTGSASIAISPIFGIIWISGIGYAIWKYRFLRWTPESISGNILNNVDEAIVVLDTGYQLVYTNDVARRILADHATDPANEQTTDRAFTILLHENPSVKTELGRLLSGDIHDFSCRVPVPPEAREFLDVKCAQIKDDFGDILGITFIGRTVKDEIRFKNLFPLTDKEMEVLRMVIEGKKANDIATSLNVAVRTVKYYLAAIYAKMNVKNKIELYNVLKTYKLFSEQDAESSAFPLLLKKPRI